MEKVWLTEVLKNGEITDNTEFSFFSSTDNSLYKNGNRFKELYRGINSSSYSWKDETSIWHFLLKNSIVLQDLTSNQDFIKENLILLNAAEYEHNTIDSLYQIEGTGFGHWKLKTGNLIGFIRGFARRHEYLLNISSRFGNKFLKALIADADGFLEVENFGGMGGQSEMEWLLVYFWKIKLKHAFRLGIPKSYISIREPLSTVRGNLDIVDYTIRGKHTASYQCQYRQHSFEHPVNQLIHSVFQKFKSSPLLEDVASIRRAFATVVKGKRVSMRSLVNVKAINNPYYHPYNKVIELSKQLLRDEFADFGASSDTNALLFDVSMLFEYFIRKLVSRAGLMINLKNEKHALNIPSGGTYKNGRRALYPDLVFTDEKDNTHIFDVKYKRFDFRYGVKREDLFQINTYLGQVANAKNVVRCGFIYPIVADNLNYPKNGFISNTFLHHGKNIKFEIHFFKVPLKHSNNYRQQFKENSHEFIRQFLKT